MRRFILPLVVSLLAAAPLAAECVGTDLFAALPEAERAAITANAHQAPFAQGLIFRATKDGQEITLAGTFHMPDARHQALVDELTPALEEATELLVEAGPAEEAKLKSATTENPGLLFNMTGPTLPERLSEEDWQALQKILSERGIPAVLAAKMKPAFLAVMLAVPPCAMGDLQAGKGGLDKALIAEAEARGLPIAALEPWDTALKLFDGATPEEETEILRAIRLDATDPEDNTTTMANFYFAREPRMIWDFSAVRAQEMGLSPEEVQKQMDLSEDLLVRGRNKAWIPVLEAAAAKGPVLAAFGALHLSGADGVLALLQADGWTITRLD